MSVPTDEPLCLCTCMGMSQASVLQVPRGERMQEFWRTLSSTKGQVRKSLIFVRGTTPATILHTIHVPGRSLSNSNDATQLGKVTSNGLLLSYPACEVAVPKSLPPDDKAKLDSITDDIHPLMYYVCYIRHGPHAWYAINNKMHVLPSFRQRNGTLQKKSRRNCIRIGTCCRERVAPWPRPLPCPHRNNRASGSRSMPLSV